MFDPKERWIHAAAFPERVAHQAIMNLCEPVFERAAVFDSYACRKGKGQVAAGERARLYARRYPWFLKMDVRKYFDSIPHARMLELLARLFKDACGLRLFEKIVGSYETRPGHGLPIGSLTKNNKRPPGNKHCLIFEVRELRYRSHLRRKCVTFRP